MSEPHFCAQFAIGECISPYDRARAAEAQTRFALELASPQALRAAVRAQAALEAIVAMHAASRRDRT